MNQSSDKRPPAGLTPSGRRAFRRAVGALGIHATEDRAEQAERYARACDLAARLTADWEKLDRPSTDLGGATGRTLVAHPLVAMIREAEKDAAKFWDDLGLKPARAQGRPVGSASAPDRAAAPPKLRSVKS